MNNKSNSGKDSETSKLSNKIIKRLNNSKGKVIPKFHAQNMILQTYKAQVLEVERGEVSFQVEISAEMVNPLGFLYGGVQCSLLDDTIAIAAATLGNENFAITLNLNVNFLGKGRKGDIIELYGKVVKEGRNVIHSEGKIINKNGILIATANSDLIMTSINRAYVKTLQH